MEKALGGRRGAAADQPAQQQPAELGVDGEALDHHGPGQQPGQQRQIGQRRGREGQRVGVRQLPVRTGLGVLQAFAQPGGEALKALAAPGRVGELAHRRG